MKKLLLKAHGPKPVIKAFQRQNTGVLVLFLIAETKTHHSENVRPWAKESYSTNHIIQNKKAQYGHLNHNLKWQTVCLTIKKLSLGLHLIKRGEGVKERPTLLLGM